MTRMKPTIIAAFIAGMSISGLGYAADKATGKSLEEAGIENPKAAAERGPKGGYESVRKEHVDAAATPEKGAAGPSGAAAGTRDWAAVDKNNDNLIQPDEMSTWLEKVGPQAAAAAKSDKSSAGAAGPSGTDGAAAKSGDGAALEKDGKAVAVDPANPKAAGPKKADDAGAAGPTGAGGAAAKPGDGGGASGSSEKAEGKPTTQSGDAPK